MMNNELQELEKSIKGNNISLSNIAALFAIGLPATIKSIELNNELIQLLGIVSSLLLGTTTGIMINKKADRKTKVKRK